jgi:hypothetical protein
VDRPENDRHYAFQAVGDLVLCRNSASHSDGLFTDSSHPLSSFRVNIGSASLRGSALVVAAAAASSPNEYAWVRDQATELLRSRNELDTRQAAAALCRLSGTADNVDPGLLAAHEHFNVRQASALLCMRSPARHHKTALSLSHDPDFRVRRELAQAAARVPQESAEADVILHILAGDPRHSVRVVAGSRQTCSDRGVNIHHPDTAAATD